MIVQIPGQYCMRCTISSRDEICLFCREEREGLQIGREIPNQVWALLVSSGLERIQDRYRKLK